VKARAVVTTAQRNAGGQLEVGFHLPSPKPGEPFGYGALTLFGSAAELAEQERIFGIASEHELQVLQTLAAPVAARGAPVPVKDETRGPRRVRWLGGR
jgi:hypothetical protein